MTAPPLELCGVSKWYRSSSGLVRAVWAADLVVGGGEVVALVGRSGAGKSTLARIAAGLQEPDQGVVRIFGRRFSALRERERRRMRRFVQYMGQDPAALLDPLLSCGLAVEEPLMALASMGRRERRERVRKLLCMVDLPEDVAGRKPSELSGGQRQRVALARALAVEPSLLVLDEPWSHLDAGTRSSLLELLSRLRGESSTAMLIVSHDLQGVAKLASRVIVMLGGLLVEGGPFREVVSAPLNPYTEALVLGKESGSTAEFSSLGADGCPFSPVCPLASSLCGVAVPPRVWAEGGRRFVRCWNFNAGGCVNLAEGG